MRRCARCIYPATKPDLLIDEEGVCSACRAYERRPAIDWAARRRELEELLEQHRGDAYDCLVPVSGGKDSTYQVLKMLRDFGARPLIVNAATDYLSPIGRQNLDNLKRFGDVVEVTPNTAVRRAIARTGLFEVGDLSWGEHSVIWSVPFRVAAMTGVKLIVYGEQPQDEYGGPAGSADRPRLDERWRAEFGGFLGMRTADLVGRAGITERDLHWYTLPPSIAGIDAVWLGRYVPWNGAANAIYAGAFGFQTLGHAVEGSLGDYENLDNYATGPRDYLRFVKFGYARATDICCNLIRRGWLTRDDGLAIIAERERFPWRYLDIEISRILEYFGVALEEFVDVCDRYTNRSLFASAADGSLRKDRDGTPVLKEAA